MYDYNSERENTLLGFCGVLPAADGTQKTLISKREYVAAMQRRVKWEREKECELLKSIQETEEVKPSRTTLSEQELNDVYLYFHVKLNPDTGSLRFLSAHIWTVLLTLLYRLFHILYSFLCIHIKARSVHMDASFFLTFRTYFSQIFHRHLSDLSQQSPFRAFHLMRLGSQH